MSSRNLGSVGFPLELGMMRFRPDVLEDRKARVVRGAKQVRRRRRRFICRSFDAALMSPAPRRPTARLRSRSLARATAARRSAASRSQFYLYPARDDGNIVSRRRFISRFLWMTSNSIDVKCCCIATKCTPICFLKCHHVARPVKMQAGVEAHGLASTQSNSPGGAWSWMIKKQT